MKPNKLLFLHIIVLLSLFILTTKIQQNLSLTLIFILVMFRGTSQKKYSTSTISQTKNKIMSSTNQVNERVLKSCHEIYTKPDSGLCDLAKNIDTSIELLVPRKKISILLMGNHSAGKSSFINWYLDEHVQKTGVAIETQGFTVVTSGKKRESLTGNATLHLYPHFKQLVSGVPEVVEHLTTEVSTSKSKKFPLVNLIDSPGLVDGEMKYPFDINKAILWWAGLVDLIFVFFDPIGQALCKRTLDICEQMAENGHREKMKFYLSKADEAGHEADRQRVIEGMIK